MLREFEYAAPSSLRDVCVLLQEVEGAVAFAGGTDVVVCMQNGKIAPSLLVDLKKIPCLATIAETDDGVEIGALVSMTELNRSRVVASRFPALSTAAGSLGCWQVRNRATLGGNLCNASPSADSTPALFLYGAVVVISNGERQREIPIEDFLQGPGQTALGRDEILTTIRMPFPPGDLRAAYVRRSIRRSMDIPLVNVAVGVRRSGELISDAQVILGAVAPVCLRAGLAQQLLNGAVPSAEVVRAAARKAAEEARPITDVRATAGYRSAMVEVLVRRALNEVLEVAA